MYQSLSMYFVILDKQMAILVWLDFVLSLFLMPADK